jgi:cytidylate kinase
MIIAVDGPAASGKGTIARALAMHYDLPHLDTGLLYRAVGVATARAGRDPDVEADAVAGCRIDETLLADPELRTEAEATPWPEFNEDEVSGLTDQYASTEWIEYR